MNIHSPTVHNPNVTLRAALYLRVSTTRQAEHDVSIPEAPGRSLLRDARLSARRNIRGAGQQRHQRPPPGVSADD